MKDFKTDFVISGAVERYLQVSIGCIIDIGNEIISLLQLKGLDAMEISQAYWPRSG